MSTLRLIHYALLLTPAYWKSSNTNARLVAFTLSLALDPIFGIRFDKIYYHCYYYKTLDNAQPRHLLKPNWKLSSSHSISTPTNISFCYSHLCVYVCVCARMHVCVCVCVCVCVWEREREKKMSVGEKKLGVQKKEGPVLVAHRIPTKHTERIHTQLSPILVA